MLIWLLLIPLFSSALVLAFGKHERSAFGIAFISSLLSLGLGLLLAGRFSPAENGLAFESQTTWLPSLGITLSLGIDGIALMLVQLTLFLAPITLYAARSSIENRQQSFCFWFLILNFSMLGTLLVRDLFLFFVFWELMLIPMYLMIGIWGGKNREYAGLKFFLYTIVGSVPMLIAIVYLGVLAGGGAGHSNFSYDAIASLSLSLGEQIACFLACGISFAIKMPLWPFHTWLPDAHTEAPTPGSVLLAGVLLKMGGYGFVRIAIPFFPEGAQAFAPVICVLALIAIIAGSLVAMVQTDVKRLVAYSSVAHMGAVMLGLFCLNREGLSGGMFQMLAHGISTGGLFLLVGFLYERRHTREFDQFGGIAKVMPLFCVCFVFVSLSSLALPGMNGFVGEFLIFAGAYARHPALAAFAVLGAILGAWYMLSAIRRIFFGNLTRPENQGLKDLTSRELLIMAPLLVAILWMGVSSQTFLDPMKPDVERVIAHAAPATPEGGR
jgi:NADH-quinone oxidoreductase subunit M